MYLWIIAETTIEKKHWNWFYMICLSLFLGAVLLTLLMQNAKFGKFLTGFLCAFFYFYLLVLMMHLKMNTFLLHLLQVIFGVGVGVACTQMKQFFGFSKTFLGATLFFIGLWSLFGIMGNIMDYYIRMRAGAKVEVSVYFLCFSIVGATVMRELLFGLFLNRKEKGKEVEEEAKASPLMNN